MVTLIDGLRAKWRFFRLILGTLGFALDQFLAHGGRAYLINLTFLKLQILVDIRLGLVLDETHV